MRTSLIVAACVVGAALSTPNQYYPHFDTTPDYLNIAHSVRGVDGNSGSVSDNFYLVIGDQGGADGGCPHCGGWQKQVARKMQEYVSHRRSHNSNSQLLFVITVGDSFYWTGAKPGRFSGTWKNIYEGELTGVPWFAVMGNHDYGSDDPGSACGWRRSKFRCSSQNQNSAACGGARPYSTGTQDYAGNQINADKGGVDGSIRQNYHMPDYTYFYSIPQLSFEIIAMDFNIYDFGGMGGNGPSGGARKVTDFCGGQENFRHALQIMKDASLKLFNERAEQSLAKNVAIVGHYPPNTGNGGHNFYDMFRARNRRASTVFNFYGHTHKQRCEGSSGGQCHSFLTGGGGGCCHSYDLPFGFVAITWDSSQNQKVECFAPDSACTIDYHYMDENVVENLTEICERTRDPSLCSSTEIIM